MGGTISPVYHQAPAGLVFGGCLGPWADAAADKKGMVRVTAATPTRKCFLIVMISYRSQRQEVGWICVENDDVFVCRIAMDY